MRFARSYLSSVEPLSHKAKTAWKRQRGATRIPTIETYGDAARAYLDQCEREESKRNRPPGLWSPDYLPSLAELEEHLGETVLPRVPYGEFCDWSDALKRDLGPEESRLLVDRSPDACEHGFWSVTLRAVT